MLSSLTNTQCDFTWKSDKAPGNFGTGYLGFKLDDQSAVQLRGLNIEIQNGRLAMLGILGMWASESIHGTTFWEFSAFK